MSDENLRPTPRELGFKFTDIESGALLATNYGYDILLHILFTNIKEEFHVMQRNFGSGWVLTACLLRIRTGYTVKNFRPVAWKKSGTGLDETRLTHIRNPSVSKKYSSKEYLEIFSTVMQVRITTIF